MFLRATFLFLLIPGLAHGILITNPANVTNEQVDPFLDDPTFLTGVANRQQFDFSGVGQTSGSRPRWATMISPDHFISANHNRPSIGSTYNFFDSTGNSIATHTVAEGQRVGTSDTWIGRFTDSVDTNLIKIYDLAAALSSPAVVIQLGLGGSTTPAYRVGQNLLEAVTNATVFSGSSESTGDFAIYLDNSAAGGLNSQANTTFGTVEQYETYFRGGDSSGPSFIDIGGGELQLIGIHSFITEVNLDANTADNERRASGDVYLPSINSEIQSIVTAVPEPSATVPMVVMACCLTLFRGHRKLRS